MIQIALFVIWTIAFISWISVNTLTYHQLMNVVALRRETKVWFMVQVIFSLIFFITAFVSIILIAPLLTPTSFTPTNEFF